MTLEDELQEINGVGEATAEKIVEIVEEHSVDSEVSENVKSAYEYYEAGQMAYAGKFIERAYNNL